MGTGLYQRTETISIGFAKIAANRRADAAAARGHPPDRRQHERHAAVCAGPVQRLAAKAAYEYHISTRHASLTARFVACLFLHTQICGKNIALRGVFLIDKLPPPGVKLISICARCISFCPQYKGGITK